MLDPKEFVIRDGKMNGAVRYCAVISINVASSFISAKVATSVMMSAIVVSSLLS